MKMRKCFLLRLKFYFYTIVWEVFIFWLTRKVFDTFYNVKGYDINYQEADQLIVIFSLLLASFPSFFIPLNNKKPSTAFFVIFYYFHVIPSILIFPILLNNFEENIILTFIIFFDVAFISYLTLYQVFLRYIKVIDMKILNNRFRYLFVFIANMFIALSFIILIKMFGFSFTFPSIFEVYIQRESFKEQLNDMPTIVSYIIINFSYAIAPFLVIKGITSKNIFHKTFFIVTGLFISIYIFSLAAYKSSIFAILFSMGTYFILKNSKSVALKLSKYIVFFVLTFVTTTIIIHNQLIETILLHWIRRMSIVQGMNVAYHIDYILKYEKILTFEAVYKNSASIISEVYYGTFGTAPAGILGSMLEFYGIIGIFLTFILLTIFLVFLDNLARCFKEEVIISLSIPIFYVITGTSITGIFFTYGFSLLILLFYLKYYNLNWRK
jgi:hypothetical protein